MRNFRHALLAAAMLLAVGTYSLAQEPFPDDPIPLNNSPSDRYEVKPLTFAQQTARFEAEQRVMRLQWNRWIGYDPARPAMNASYMSNGMQRYYIPRHSYIVTAAGPHAWYW